MADLVRVVRAVEECLYPDCVDVAGTARCRSVLTNCHDDVLAPYLCARSCSMCQVLSTSPSDLALRDSGVNLSLSSVSLHPAHSHCNLSRSLGRCLSSMMKQLPWSLVLLTVVVPVSTALVQCELGCFSFPWCRPDGGTEPRCISRNCIRDASACTCPTGYVKKEPYFCDKGAQFPDPFQCQNGLTCGYHGTCSNGTCTCLGNYRAFNGLCGGKFLKMIPGVCDETIDAAGHKCPLGGINPARCYGTRCACAYQRFRVVERCATDSFQVSECTALKCPAPARCNEDRMKCRCPPGYFAWGKVCVTYFFQPHVACNTANCPSTSGVCNGNRCVCDARHIADGEVCRMLSFPLTPGDQTNVTSCGINGMVGGSRCYCNPGYVVTRDASGTKLSCTRSFLMQQRWGDRSGTDHN
ncbi:hypothetical protein BaRGS_00012684 [Batillaria attramentaria]|uniref:EGF-like domain-containing protein n=1 Tax=Batillaria attramentaria TaxID=370345 RepID=A0ABD0L9F1_9CAEN